jgi:serine/threonine-protein kinase
VAREEAVAKGQLVVRATPYATVLLDGKRLGEVQGRKAYSLVPGQYRLTFQHPAGNKSYPVTIEAGGSVTREFRAPMR